jgi:hypothetical protein
MRVGIWLKRFFEQSSHIHARQDVAGTPGELIELIDRFVDGPMRYPLEWDDFISWEQANPNVERVRRSLGRNESWLFSRSKSKRNAYVYRLVEERNRLAAAIGEPQRELPAIGDMEAGLLTTSGRK